MRAALLGAATAIALGVAAHPKPMARTPAASAASGASAASPRLRHWGLRSTWRRRPRVDPLELAAWCDALSRALRGGATLRHALATVAPPEAVASEFGPVLLALDRGASTVDALDAFEHAPPHLDLVLVVLRACAQHGGAPAEPVDRAAAALRQRAALIAERESQSAQARMSASVMTVLPGVLLTVLLTTSPSVRNAVTSSLGIVTVALGAVANGIGWWWMRRVILGGARWR